MKRNGRSKCLNCGRNGKHEVLVMKDGFMRSKKTVLIKVTSLIVSFILSILSILHLYLPSTAVDTKGDQNGEYSSKDVYLLCEEKERRAEYEKHYITSDGKFIAVTYPEQIHYMDENGEFLDVDCSIKSNDDLFLAEIGDYYANFPKVLNSDALLSFGVKERSIGWTVSIQNIDGEVFGYSDSNGEILEKDYSKPDILYIDNSASFSLPNLTSTIRYKNVFDGIDNIDAVYTIAYNRIEEDIVFKSPTDASSIILSFNSAFDTVVNYNGSVDFYIEEELQFSVGSPYLYDAVDENSNNVQVYANSDNGATIITYILDRSWLEDEEREYPIVFDPSITTKEYASNIVDTYVQQDDSADHSSEAKLYFGIKSNKLTRSYIKINNLPDINSNCPVLSARLYLTLYPTTTTGKAVSLYKVNQAWNPNSITFSNQPSNVTYISSSPFDASNLYHNLNITSDFVNLYDDYLSASNNGYMIRYSDESFTNPDYNSALSTDYTTDISYRPVFTVVYGYTLPVELQNGGIYVFENAGSLSIMNVHNGLDSNKTNVYQVDTFPSNATSAQKFKLDYIPATGCYSLRAMCSSNGTNRVLDIVKTNGYVESGCNVQLFNPTDVLAQHWLIIPLGGEYFKIIPRTNMSLALTAFGYDNGTADGTSPLSYGNIFVSEYYESNFQKWSIYNCTTGEYVSSSNSQALQNNTYYFNNLFTGKYIHANGATAVNAASGLVSGLGNTVRWRVTYQGDDLYTIQSSTNLSLYLNHASNNTVNLINCSGNDNIPSSCLWKIKTNSGIYIAYDIKDNNGNVISTRYLSNSGTTLSLVTSRGDFGSESFDKTTWRVANMDYFNGRELNSGFTISDMEIQIGNSNTPTINHSPTNALWANPSDFTYSIIPNGKITMFSGNFNAISRGVVEVTATHKVTNLMTTFEIFVTNAPLSNTEITRLYNEFDALLGDGYATMGGINFNTVSEVIDKIVENDQTITNYCNEYRIPKEFVQSVLFRELWYVNVLDAAADALVQEYYAWMLGNGPHPLIERTDSSTGLGQIFASTAIKALNNADDRGFISLPYHYNNSVWQDVWYIWHNLHDDNSYNIKCCSLVILDCQYEYASILPYDEFFDCTESQIKTILSRYNGYGPDAATYGNCCYDYFLIFEAINS